MGEKKNEGGRKMREEKKNKMGEKNNNKHDHNNIVRVRYQYIILL